MSDYDMSIHSNTDALAWAKFFMENAKKNGWNVGDITEDMMHGWFANAMMAMSDSIPREAKDEDL